MRLSRTYLIRLPIVLIAVTALAATSASWASGSAKQDAKKTKPAKQESLSGLGAMEVSVDKGVPLNLSAPAASVFIANPDVADVQLMSPTSVMVYGKKTGQTTLMATDNLGNTLLHRTVVVRQNLADLRAALKTVIPNGDISVDDVPNGLILTGSVKDPAAVEDARRLALRYLPKDGGEVINRIKVRGGNQIQIRVRFAEVSRDADKKFGINWESFGTFGGYTLGLAAGNSILPTKPGTSVPYFPQGDVGSSWLNVVRPTTGGAVNDVISLHKGSTNAMIDALAQDGLVTVLAEPNLTAMSGETASFLAGGEFPIPVPQGNGSIGIEWKTYGVSLSFTPTLIGTDRINLHVRPEVSQLTDAGSVTLNSVTVPALTTRRAETSIELASGQSFAIGGLLNNSQNQAVSKYPFLGDLPILGALFRSTSFQNSQSELVILITPYIVRPATEENLTLPTDGFSPPSDVDRIFLGRTSNSEPGARPLSGPPRAAYEEPASSEVAPQPVAAPVEPVTSSGESTKAAMPLIPPVLPAPEAPRMSLPVPSAPSVRPAKTLEEPKNPAGPSGYVVE